MLQNTVSERLYNRLSKLSDGSLLLVLLAVAAVLFFTGIGFRSPWPADEPRYVEVAREMVASGQWLIPQRGGEFYPDKPPVFFWSIAFFYWLTGNLKLAFLLPNALCGLAMVTMVFDLGRRLWGRSVAAGAVILLLLAPQFMIQAKNAQIDAMVACWITVGCYGLLRHFLTGPAWGWYFTAWGFMGLGIITKGTGFLPALMMLPILYLGLRARQPWQQNLGWRCLLGPLVMLAVAACWLVPMVLYVNHVGSDELIAYRDNILFKQTGERYADSWGHLKPWYYFFASVVPSLWFPLPLLALACIGKVWSALREDRVVWVLMVWVLLVLLFFSISPGKRGVYILPALPMFALALAAAIGNQKPARWFGPVMAGLQILIGVALVVIGIAGWMEHASLVKKVSRYTTDMTLLHQAGVFVMVAGMVWLSLLAAFWRSPALMRLFVPLMTVWLMFSTWGYTLMEPLRTPRNVLMAAEAVTPSDAELGVIDFDEQLILFSKRDITHFSYFAPLAEEERTAWRWIADAPQRYLLLPGDLTLECFDISQGQFMGKAHRERWVLLTPQARRPSCPEPILGRSFHTEKPGRWMDGELASRSNTE